MYSIIFISFTVSFCNMYIYTRTCLRHYFWIIVLLEIRLTAKEQREKPSTLLRDKRRVEDFTIPKIDNSGQAFYGVAAKLHDALPRSRVSQDVLDFVRARAKCVSTYSFKGYNFSTKSFFLRENFSGNVREAESRFREYVRGTTRRDARTSYGAH